MPRPGPRPYECVRRAWHSDRHQPIRGSLIQQIFRVVNEAHLEATKNKKEWQEKLPIVVLKAEEIMYSKANSEAEYTNLDTLWDRLSDAINTIIRLEETTETGDLLPPCVEAALNLGCVPVRASRSQRHSNPRTYLTPRAQEPPPPPPPTTATRVSDGNIDKRRPQLLPFQSGNQLSFARTPVGNSSNFHNSSFAAPWGSNVLSHEHVLSGHGHLPAMDSTTSMNVGSVYPLYYGTHYQAEEYRHLGPQVPEQAHSKTIYVGTPVIANPSVMVSDPHKQDRFVQMDVVEAREMPPEAECDLSLRLGMFSHPFGRTEKNSACNDNVGSSASPQLGKLSDTQQLGNKEICFFPGKPANDPFESNSRTWNSSTGEGQSSEANIRKGKEPFSGNEEGRQFCRRPSVPSNWFHS